MKVILDSVIVLAITGYTQIDETVDGDKKTWSKDIETNKDSYMWLDCITDCQIKLILRQYNRFS